MIKCNYCNAANTGKYRFCDKCGNPLDFTASPENKEDIPQNDYKDPNSSPGNSYQSTDAGFEPVGQLPPQKPRSAKPLIITVAIFGIVVCIGAFFLFKRFLINRNYEPAETYTSNAYPVTPQENNVFDTTTNSTPTYQDADVEPKQESVDKPKENTVYNPQEDFFNFIGQNTWKGRMIESNQQWESPVTFRSDGSGKVVLVLEIVPCTSLLTFKSLQLVGNDEYVFLFDEEIILNPQNCSAGLVSMTALASQPNRILVKFHDLDYQTTTAQGYFERY